MRHKPGGRLPLLSARPAVTPATLKRAATNFAAWWTDARWVWTVCLRLLPDSVSAAIWTRALLHANHSATEPSTLYVLRDKSAGWLSVVRSAGVGRTGVFVTLSIVLERMRYEGAVDMFQTVKMLFTQRPAMVQTEVDRLNCSALTTLCWVSFVCHLTYSLWKLIYLATQWLFWIYRCYINKLICLSIYVLSIYLSIYDATRICCWALAACSMISPAGGALSSKPAGRRCCCRSMGQTDGLTGQHATIAPLKLRPHGAIQTCLLLLLLLFLSPPAQSRRQENQARHTKLWLQRQFTLLPWCCGKKPHFLFAEPWKGVGEGM